MKRLILPAALCISAVLPTQSKANNILESFTVTTQNVEVRQFSESSMQLKSDSNAYFIKLEPNRAGKVIFALTGIGYTSTVKFTNLFFGVKITGYHDGQEIQPTYSFDDVNRDIVIDNGMLIFRRIYGSLPVWFDEQVDSINLKFSNSLSVHLNQYLGIQDIKILQPVEINSNPTAAPCKPNYVMIGIDGSSSIDKDERVLIGQQLLEFVRRSGFARDSHTLCVMEFGTDIMSVKESTEKHTLVDALQKYKRRKNHKSKYTSWTNWSIALDEAIAKKPDVYIFITDGWSNWSGNHASSFSAQYESLFKRCNTLKANGTRLLFITSDIDIQNNSKIILANFLNGQSTLELQEDRLNRNASLKDVDLITLNSFSMLSEINFSSLLDCPVVMPEILHKEDDAFVSVVW
jgi:hypothetical protein